VKEIVGKLSPLRKVLIIYLIINQLVN